MTALISTVGIKFDDFGTPAKLKKTAAAAKQTEKSFDQLAGKAAVGSQKIGLFGKAALGVGASSSIGAVGVKALGVAIKSTFAPLIALSGAVAGLGTAFNTLKEIDFAKAKLDTLGVASDDLVNRLKILSIELNGSASIAELAGAGYDVASAGFTDAADAAMILKAASLGATGGFTDINTSGGAAVKVLNAYGLEAKDAASLMDKFAQTQADGIITIGQYSQNIGKVATTAAGLKVPLEEVNAVIAQSTAAGTNIETAFTGLNAALAKISSGQAGKKLGIDLNEATLNSEGLVGALKKLEGFSTGELQQAFGIEAFKGIQVAIQNTEKLNQLIENQVNSQGRAAEAAFTAQDTIAGSWKRIVSSFSNLFGEQTELGEAIKFTLYGISAAIDLIGASIKLILAPVRLVWSFFQGIGDALMEAFGIESVNLVQAFTEGWNLAFKDLEESIQKAIKWTREWAGGIVEDTKKIQIAFHNVMEHIKAMWYNFIPDIYNATPQWLRKILGMDGEDMPTYKMNIKVYTSPGDDPSSGSSGSSSSSGGVPDPDKANKYVSVLDVIKDKWGQITDIVAGGLTNAVMGLIDGTKSLGESLAGIAKSLASMFLQAGFKSLIGGIFPTAAEGAHWGGGFKAFAKGGVATGPTLGLVGEAGEDEYVIPSSKMQGAMERYSAGARGQGVIPGGGTVASGSGVSSSPTVVNYTGPVLSFNSEAYVPKSAIPEIINSAARRGAQEGQSKVFSQLKNSRSQRSRVGL